MAKTEPKTEREPVTQRGRELLQLIANAGDAGIYLTQPEALDAINAGFAVADTGDTQGNTARVRLTETGSAQLTVQTAAKGASTFAISASVPVPTKRRRRGRDNSYPFDQLEIGQSFHVAPSEEYPNPATRLASSVSGANKRWSEEIPGETEVVDKKTYKRLPDGKFEKTEDGKRVLEKTEKVTRAKTKQLREFMVASVGKEDPEGPGARVWRVEIGEGDAHEVEDEVEGEAGEE